MQWWHGDCSENVRSARPLSSSSCHGVIASLDVEELMDQKLDTANESNKVVSLFSAAQKPAEKMESPTADAESFEAELKRNRELAEKLKKERQKANQAVLRSYRLKT